MRNCTDQKGFQYGEDPSSSRELANKFHLDDRSICNNKEKKRAINDEVAFSSSKVIRISDRRLQNKRELLPPETPVAKTL